MSALSIQVPFPVFQDRDGQPLDNGYVWLGTSSLNPQTNPVVAYYDSALTIVATQPLRTLNGFISRAGSPAQVYVDAVNFSILVQDRQGTTVFSVPEGTGISPNASGVVYDPAGTGAVATTVQAKLRESVSVKDFGAVGDGITNDRAAIIAAITSLQSTGGKLIFPPGSYLITGVAGTYSIPALSAALGWTTEATEVQMYFAGLSDIDFEFRDATLVSSKTDGGVTLALNGCNNLSFYNLSMRGATVMSGSTVTTAGTGAIALLSTTQNSSNIDFYSPKITAHYSGIDVAGDPASSYRVKNVSVHGSAAFSSGYYGVVCRGNGVGVHVYDAYSYRLNRPFFVYDTEDVHITMVGDEMNGGFQAIVKAYTVPTLNITVDFTVKGRANTQACLGLQSQHNPTTQPTPAYLRDIKVRYTDAGAVAGGSSILFSYYRDTTLTATSNQFLFGDIELEGRSSGTVTSDVQLTSVTNYCTIRMDRFKASNGLTLYTGASGFIPSYVSTWTPADGSGAALTLATAAGRYTVGNVVVGSFSVTYPATANGSAASISGLPITSYGLPQSTIGVSIGYTDCGFDIYGLIGATATTISWYKNTGASVINSDLSGKTIRGTFTYFP